MTTRRSRRPPKHPTVIASPPGSLRARAAEFIEWTRIKNYSEATVELRRYYLERFVDWAEARDITDPLQVTRPVLESYQRFLYHRRKEDGRPLSASVQISSLSPVRSLFRWLAKQNLILSNPASDLELPKLEQRLPKAVLTVQEVERVLAQPDVRTPLGLRDRAILELFYSTGMRRAELAHLTVSDIDVERGTIVIRQGKGKKDRMLPGGERALAWVERYMTDVRPSLIVPPDPQILFLGHLGEPFSALTSLTVLVRRYVDAADVGKRGSCHLLRHTAATLMMENGADLRAIQQLLGHARVTTTEIYTQVSIRRLKQVHADTHPGAKLQRKPPSDGGEPTL